MSKKTIIFCDRCGKNKEDPGIKSVSENISISYDGNSTHVDTCQDCRRVLIFRIEAALEDWKKGR